MLKFDIKDPSKVFLLNDSSRDLLFLIGYDFHNDIVIYKKPNEIFSYCTNNNFNYSNNQNALRGIDENYSPKRFIVIQMK